MDFNLTGSYNLLHGQQLPLRLVATITLDLQLHLEIYGVLASFLWTSTGLRRGDRRLARPLNHFADLVLDIFWTPVLILGRIITCFVDFQNKNFVIIDFSIPGMFHTAIDVRDHHDLDNARIILRLIEGFLLNSMSLLLDFCFTHALI